MTEAQLKKLTLEDLERIAGRFSKAVREIREGQALLAGGAAPQPSSIIIPSAADIDASGIPPGELLPAPVEDAAAAHRRRQFQPVEDARPKALAVQTDPRARLSAAERAERERIIRGGARAPVDPNLPEDMQSMERGE